MSRTYKDRPTRVKYPRVDNWVFTEGYGRRDLPTIEPKKRKEVDTEEHWMSTPGWWIRCMMNKPQRKAGSIWERAVVTTKNILDIDLLHTPSDSRKPHIYYW